MKLPFRAFDIKLRHFAFLATAFLAGGLLVRGWLYSRSVNRRASL